MIDLTDRTVAVLMGGPGSERQVSLASGKGVAAALRELSVNVVEVDVQGPEFQVPAGVEIAFNVIHGTFGEDGQLQRILEERGIPYTGEGVATSEVAIDKIASKRRFAAGGVPTAPFEVIGRDAVPGMSVPLVIKAPKEGSSVGVYIVKEPSELAASLEKARKYSDELLIEQFIPGRELTVGILGDQALPIIEIVAKKDFYNFENKYPFLNPNAAGADHYCPAPLSPEQTREIQEIALSAHRALGLQTYSRVDLQLSESGQAFVLEINTIPGMTPSSLLPEAAAAVGVSYPALCARIIELSFAARPPRSS